MVYLQLKKSGIISEIPDFKIDFSVWLEIKNGFVFVSYHSRPIVPNIQLLGVAFCLSVLGQWTKLDSLHWMESVEAYLGIPS